MQLDETDHAIIDHLRRDGRLSNVALADAVHLTPGPCLRRVQRLEAEGVIQGYTAQVDPGALGQGFEVILDVELTAYDRGTVERFETTMQGFDEVVELYRLFGSPDYYVRVAGNDYSVDPAAIGQLVEVSTTLGQVRVTRSGRLLAAHDRCWAARQSVTDPAHVQTAAALRQQFQPVRTG